MSDTKECCVCYEATEHSTPCNHLVCEPCFPRLNTCPICRASVGRPVEEEDSDFDIDEANQGMLEAAFDGHIEIVRQMLSRGAEDFNEAMAYAAFCGTVDA